MERGRKSRVSTKVCVYVGAEQTSPGGWGGGGGVQTKIFFFLIQTKLERGRHHGGLTSRLKG